MEYLYHDLTEKIITAYYTVYHFYRAHPGYDEDNLRDALKLELEKMGLSVVAETDAPRAYQGHTLGKGYIDLVVEGKVALELKVAVKIQPDAVDQLDTYLTDAHLAVGLVLKFHRSRPEIKRRFNRAAAPMEQLT